MFVSKLVPQNLNKQRVDIILKELNLVESRTQALALVMAGNVFVDNKKINKPGKLINSNTTIKLKKNDHNWVSRGGIKLNYAFKKFDINVYEKISLDIGCSTGGFTDVLLYAGAKKVYAVDVGYGQFDWKLRNSDKVTLLERTNAKKLNSKIIPELMDIIVCDVSFISIRKVLMPTKQLIGKDYEIVALIKPQFEATKEQVGRGGIIKDTSLHTKICNDALSWFKNNFNYNYIDIIESPILGQKGNKEFFIYLKN